MSWAQARLQEASSWVGVGTVILGAFHIANASGMASAIAGVATAVAGLLGVIIKERGGTA